MALGDGYSITSAIRESAGAIGLIEHHGRPGFWASRWNRLAVTLFLVLIGLVTLAAVIGSRHG